MRIGILTHPLVRNYGGILQAWALQQVVKDLGFEPQTIDWDYNVPTWKSYCRSLFRSICLKIIGRNVGWPHGSYWIPENYRGLRQFVKKNICLTPRIPFGKVISYIVKNYKTVIVGSDQVWRFSYIPQITTMFLPYKKNVDGKKIAYAASFGTDDWEYSDEQTKRCADLLSDFDAVSVREKSALNLCADKLKYFNCKWVLDPVLLINMHAYETICSSVDIDGTGCVFAYILDENSELLRLAQLKAKEQNIPLKVVSVDNEIKSTDTIEKWLASFRDARYIITDSFHGTLFSIIFKKEFAVYRNQKRGNARFDSLIELFPQIKGRLINNDKLPTGPIDWEEIEKIQNIYKKDSIEFLSQSLIAQD